MGGEDIDDILNAAADVGVFSSAKPSTSTNPNPTLNPNLNPKLNPKLNPSPKPKKSYPLFQP